MHFIYTDFQALHFSQATLYEIITHKNALGLWGRTTRKGMAKDQNKLEKRNMSDCKSESVR